MAGAFSGHLLNSYQSVSQLRPFGQHSSTSSPSISTHGPISFNPQMHGNVQSQPSFSLDSQPSYMDISQATADKIERLQAKLNQKLGPEYISQRPGPGGGPKLTYAEGWKIINLANEVFGFNGWSSSVVSLTVDFIDFNEESRRYTIGVTSIIRVTLRDGVFHEDIGYGMLENSKSKGAALDKCKKEAVTDGLKRALRNFGNLLGNCLYDKSYTAEVIKIKVSPPKFDRNELHRRPEFDDSTSNTASASASTSTLNTVNQTPSRHPNIVTPTIQSKNSQQVKPELNQQLPGSTSKPLSSLPPHMRSEATGFTNNGKGTSSAVVNTMSATVRPAAETIPAQSDASMHQPQQQTRAQPQSGRKVSFSEMPPREQTVTDEFGEDSFTSEDDAFLAAVDLGEGDLGRPILTEDCMERPIDFEEGLGVISDESPGGNDAVNKRAKEADQTPPCGSNLGQQQQLTTSNQPPQLQAQAPRMGFSSNRTTISPSDGSSSRILQEQKPPQQPRLTSNPSPSTFSGPSNNSKISSGSSWPNQNQNQDQNHNPAASTTNVAHKRPATPSMGGFHFPPGMNPLGAQARPGPPQSLQRPSGTGQSSFSSGIGQKRPADAMQGFARRPVQGMGLGHQPGGGGKREPLARVDLGESGDVKRMKL